jgi:hypothetical protein
MSVIQTIASESSVTGAPIDRLSAARLAFRTNEWAGERRLDAGKQFSAQYLRRLAAVLTLEEITTILTAEQYREQGLALSRGGDNHAAGALLAQAATTCEQAQLSRHASVAALSFQLAAEAYIRHRLGDHAGAIRDLENAIIAAAELEAVFGHDMEFRRVHLARNILRVRTSEPIGRNVVADHIALLRYIGGDVARWPIVTGRGVGNPAAMTVGQAAWVIDELLVNLALPALDLGRNVDLLPKPEDCGDHDSDLHAAALWCHALANLARDRQQGFIDHATSFFEAGSGCLIHAGRHLESLLQDLGIVLDR